MSEYVYRVISRVRPEHWDAWRDPAENVWRVRTERPYTRAASAKGAATLGNNTYPTLEFRAQRLPADDWEFIDGS